jgi:hypothetical protein
MDSQLLDAPPELPAGARLVDAQMTRLSDDAPARGPEVHLGKPGLRNDTALLRAKWENHPFHVHTAEDIELFVAKGIAPLAGGSPVGSSAMAFLHNVPGDVAFVEDTGEFFANTERQDIPQPPIAFPAFSAPGDFKIPNVGVLSGIRFVLKLTLVVSGGGTVTSTYQWPWNVCKRVSLNANGQTQIISAEGNDLRARRQRFFRNPREEVSTAPATDALCNPTPGVISNGTYSVVLVYDIPISHDDYNMAGSLYAQSDQNSLAWRIEAAASADLFTLAGGSTATLSGTVTWTMTTFNIPSANTQKGRQVLLPDMSWIHGFLGANQPFSNTGEVPIALLRTTGQLECTYIYLDNGGAAAIDPLALTEVRFQYGGNQRPRAFNPVEQLVEKNGHDYNGRILTKVGYFLLDNQIDNPIRDLVLPKGVTELQVVAVIPAGTSLNANSHAHFVEETMYKGR